MLSREYGDIAGAGGVKDVVQQLAEQLAKWNGRKINVVLPLYGFIDPECLGASLMSDPAWPEQELVLTVDMNYAQAQRQEKARVWSLTTNRVNLYLLESERFSEKGDVYTYTTWEEDKTPWKKHGRGHFDYFAMNVLLQKAALGLIVTLGEKPDVIHCHDGHTALLPALSNCCGWRDYYRTTGMVVTVHNAGKGYHQEVEDLPFAEAICGLPKNVIESNLLDGAFDPFLAAASCSVLNTVSENYARELQQTGEDRRTGWLGHELKNRGVHLEGITNGIDTSRFNTLTSSDLIVPFDRDNEMSEGKRKSKKGLLKLLSEQDEVLGLKIYGRLSLSDKTPLFTFVARLNEQKGIDELVEALPKFLSQTPEAQVLLQGGGAKHEEDKLEFLALRPELQGRLMFVQGYSAELARNIYAAGDFFLVPSLYEPCGLTDFIAQLHGAVPVVRNVGGLMKVVDGETGISFSGDANSFTAALQRAVELYNNKEKLVQIQKRAIELIQEKYTWDTVKSHYLALYKKAIDFRGT